MPSRDELRQQLLKIDNRGYKSYKSIEGTYQYKDFTLIIDHVQGDPFALPSRMRVKLPQSFAEVPLDLFMNKSRRIALCDFLTRGIVQQCQRYSKSRGTGRSGIIEVDRPGQEVLERTTVLIAEDEIEARFAVGLPARGRNILGRQAAEMLCDLLPKIVIQSLKYSNLDAAKVKQFVETVEDADWIRGELEDRKLIAFIPNGALLPRSSGISQEPMATGSVPFESPQSLRVEFHRPNYGKIMGMGIPRGVTLIVGGGFHGKSTLLEAIQRGVYNHIPGDGREFVVSHSSAVKIRSEDGRRVAGVDISSFINNLPQRRSTASFWTEDASGSTSQAANTMEALEVGAKVLLIDEDTAATNFMIRDHRMQELIVKEHEPIIPFVDKIQQLYGDHGVSTVLVMGGSGDYFDTADRVIAMEAYVPSDVTEKARAIAKKYEAERKPEGGPHFGYVRHRIPIPESLDPSQGKKEVRLKTQDTENILFGSQDIDLSAVEQIVDQSQVRAIAYAMVYAKRHCMDTGNPLSEVLDRAMKNIEENGLDILTDFPQGDLAGFRRFELAAAINRLRTFEVR